MHLVGFIIRSYRWVFKKFVLANHLLIDYYEHINSKQFQGLKNVTMRIPTLCKFISYCSDEIKER